MDGCIDVWKIKQVKNIETNTSQLEMNVLACARWKV